MSETTLSAPYKESRDIHLAQTQSNIDELFRRGWDSAMARVISEMEVAAPGASKDVLLEIARKVRLEAWD